MARERTPGSLSGRLCERSSVSGAFGRPAVGHPEGRVEFLWTHESRRCLTPQRLPPLARLAQRIAGLAVMALAELPKLGDKPLK